VSTTEDQAAASTQRARVPGRAARTVRKCPAALPTTRTGRKVTVAQAGLVAKPGSVPASTQFSGANSPVPSTYPRQAVSPARAATSTKAEVSAAFALTVRGSAVMSSVLMAADHTRRTGLTRTVSLINMN
jgi:hypothetical protein